MMRASRRKNNILIFILSVFLASMFPATYSSAQEKKEVVVLVSEEIQPYAEALEGFKETLGRGPYSVAYEQFALSTEAQGGEGLKKKIAAARPDLIFTIGTPASLFAKINFINIPVVFSMVLNPVENNIVASFDGAADEITGVCLNIPVKAQLEAFKEVKPDIRRVGMLYDAKTNTRLAREAEAAAKDIGVELVSQPVFSEKSISSELDVVLAEADSLWAAPDPMIYNSSTARQIILTTLKDNIPFMAFSRNFVKAGALMALECDYHDIGSQAGDMAMKIMDRKSAAGIAVEFPRRTVLIINKRTADTIGLKIKKSVLDKAVVYGY